MALQGSGQISINDIYNEMVNGGQYEVGGERSLGALSTAAGKSAPHEMSDFYGYNAGGGAATYTASCTFSVRSTGGGGDFMTTDQTIAANMQVYKNGVLAIGRRSSDTGSFTFSAGDTLNMYSTAEGVDGEILIDHKILNGTFFYLDQNTAAEGSVELSSTITAPANNIEIRFNIK